MVRPPLPSSRINFQVPTTFSTRVRPQHTWHTVSRSPPSAPQKEPPLLLRMELTLLAVPNVLPASLFKNMWQEAKRKKKTSRERKELSNSYYNTGLALAHLRDQNGKRTGSNGSEATVWLPGHLAAGNSGSEVFGESAGSAQLAGAINHDIAGRGGGDTDQGFRLVTVLLPSAV